MKHLARFLGVLLVSVLTVPQLSANTQQEKYAAEFLVEKGVITEANDYRLDDSITRREMLKVMMNLSGKDVPNACTGRFQDLSSSDWGCKYAEAALSNGYIAPNPNFRPDDAVSNIEALKMVMQAQGIEQHQSEDWRVGYREKARDIGIIPLSVFNFSNSASRGFVFSTSAKSYTHMYGEEYIGTLSRRGGLGDRFDFFNDIVDIKDINSVPLNSGTDYDTISIQAASILKDGSVINLKILSNRSLDDIFCNPFVMSEIPVDERCPHGSGYYAYEVIVPGINFNNWRTHTSLQLCGGLNTFVNKQWYPSLEKRILDGDKLQLVCFFEELENIIVFGIQESRYRDILSTQHFLEMYFIQEEETLPGSYFFIPNNDIDFSEWTFDRVLHLRGTILTFTLKNTSGETRLIQLDLAS